MTEKRDAHGVTHRIMNALPRIDGVPASCPGCCSSHIEQVESISTEEIVDAWLQSGTHGAPDENVRAFLLEDLGTAQIEFWLCQDCGLEFAHPMKSWTENHYPGEQHSLGYDHELALAELAKMPPLRLLEIGCADGQFLERASRLGHDAMGIDFSAADIVSARKRGVNAHVADLNDVRGIASNAGKFNLIALFQVIEHLREPGKVFEEILQIAAPGAVVMVGCPSSLRYSRVYDHRERIGRSDFWDYPPQHLLRWTPRSLQSFLQRFNFQTETIAYEPLSISGATAHLTALQGLGSDWYEKRWRRRLANLRWLTRLTADRLSRRSTGIRLFVKARLKS